MPIYEYVCEDCKTRYERLVFSQSDVITCPSCGSRRSSLQLSVFQTPRSSSAKEITASGPGCGCTPTTCGCE